jgi:putative two-component system response regulator
MQTRPAPLVLLVDDRPESVEPYAMLLEQAGFRTRIALSGTDAFYVATTDFPALIVLDLVLPDLNGTELLQLLRAEATTSATPVIVLTADDREASRVRAGLYAPAAYCLKPCDPDEFLRVVRTAVAFHPAA